MEKTPAGVTVMDQEALIEIIFSRGSKIMLEYVDAQGAIKSCGTQVEDLEGSYLVLQAPIVNNVPVSFYESQELTLRCLNDKKEEAYVANVFVIDITQYKNSLLICSKPQKIDKTSLRRFSRFGVYLPLIFSTDSVSGSGFVNDISLSGCYALIDHNLKICEGMELNMIVSIPDEVDLVLNGKVIRVDRQVEKGKNGLAVDYHETTETVKEAIYNYIFQLQLTSDRFYGVMPDQQKH